MLLSSQSASVASCTSLWLQPLQGSGQSQPTLAWAQALPLTSSALTACEEAVWAGGAPARVLISLPGLGSPGSPWSTRSIQSRTMPRAAGDARDVFHFKEEQEEGRGDEGKKWKYISSCRMGCLAWASIPGAPVMVKVRIKSTDSTVLPLLIVKERKSALTRQDGCHSAGLGMVPMLAERPDCRGSCSLSLLVTVSKRPTLTDSWPCFFPQKCFFSSPLIAKCSICTAWLIVFFSQIIETGLYLTLLLKPHYSGRFVHPLAQSIISSLLAIPPSLLNPPFVSASSSIYIRGLWQHALCLLVKTKEQKLLFAK